VTAASRLIVQVCVDRIDEGREGCACNKCSKNLTKTTEQLPRAKSKPGSRKSAPPRAFQHTIDHRMHPTRLPHSYNAQPSHRSSLTAVFFPSRGLLLEFNRDGANWDCCGRPCRRDLCWGRRLSADAQGMLAYWRCVCGVCAPLLCPAPTYWHKSLPRRQPQPQQHENRIMPPTASAHTQRSCRHR